MANQLCIYCGKREAEELDHAPPKSFFAKPRPDNLITVPSCSECNRDLGKIEEFVRNILTSIDTTEGHESIKNQIEDKRNRSYEKKGGKSKLDAVLQSIKLKGIFSSEGIFLGSRPAFSLDKDEFDKFLEKMVRALLFHENDINHVEGNTVWKMGYGEKEFKSMPAELQEILLSLEVNEVGTEFKYAGIFKSGNPNSMWLLNFYNGIEFMVFFKEKKST